MLIFAIETTMAFVVYLTLTLVFVWPALKDRPRRDALMPLTAFQMFRFVGVSLLAPGIVDDAVPMWFREHIAYGDALACVLATVALILLARRSPLANAAVGVLTVVGAADLANAAYQGSTIAAFDQPLLSEWHVVTMYVPALWFSHGLSALILLRPDRAAVGGQMQAGPG